MRHHPTMSPSSFPAILQCSLFESGQGGSDANKGHELEAGVFSFLFPEKQEAPSSLSIGELEKCEVAASKVRELVTKNLPEYTLKWEDLQTEIHLADDGMMEITFGTADIFPQNLLIDLKGGLDYRIDSHYYEPQLAPYALSRIMSAKYPTIHCAEVYIMPERVREYDMDFARAASIVEAVVAKKADPPEIGQPCDYCKFCRKLLFCRAVNKWVKMTGECFGDLDGMGGNILSPGKITDPKEMGKALAFGRTILKNYAAKINEIVGAIDAAGLKMVESGVEIPNFTKKSKPGTKELPKTLYMVGDMFFNLEEDAKTHAKENHNAKITVVSGVEQAFSILGLEPQPFYEGIKLSLPDMAKAYAKAKGTTQKIARMEVEGALDSLLKTKPPKVVLNRVYAK